MSVRLLRAPLLALAIAGSLGITMLGKPAQAAAVSDRLTVNRADQPFALDPTLSDPRWASAMRANNFTDVGTRKPASESTSVGVFYDDANVYVAFKVEQRSPVIASQHTNDVGFGADDFVGFGIDTGGNAEQTYYFFTTPAGTRYQQANETARYTPVWSAAAVTTPTGWNAIMIIPLRIMKIAGNGPQPWRMNFLRSNVARNERDTWVFSPLMGDGVPPNWPYFQDARYWAGTAGVALKNAVPRPKPRASLFALGTGGGQRDVIVNPDGSETTRTPRPLGADFAYPITPTITAVGTIDPDFTNVEIDQQTIAPQQFQRQLAEYRPFFAQGAAYINTNRDGFEWNLPLDKLFYSPGIGAFDRGIKVEGTSGTQAFGILEAAGGQASDETQFDDIAWGFLHRRSNNTFAFWSDGVMAHHSDGNDTSFELGGYGRSLASGLVYGAQYGREYGTFVTQPADAQQARAFIDIQKPGFEGAISYQDIGNQYAPIDGFTNVADIRGPDMYFDWNRPFAAGSILKNVDLFWNADRWLDQSGNVHVSDFDNYLTIRTKQAERITLGNAIGSLRSYDGDTYSGWPNGYANAVDQPYTTKSAEILFGEGAPRSLDLYYSWGPFGTFFLNQVATTVAGQLGGGRSLEFDYAGTYERPFVNGVADGQWLRRLSFSTPTGAGATASISYRVISGTGGFAVPGHNFAFGFHKKFRSGNELFANYGTPAANTTLDRFVVKYLFRVNGGL